jgi:signal transduction histidine kinase
VPSRSPPSLLLVEHLFALSRDLRDERNRHGEDRQPQQRGADRPLQEEESYNRPDVDLDVSVESISRELVEPQLIPTPELNHAFVNLIDNAIKFAHRRVRIVVRLEAEVVEVGIEATVRIYRPK